MNKKTILGLVFVGLFVRLSFAPALRQTTDGQEINRQIFDAYFAAPDRENAEKVLAVLPDRIDVKDMQNLNEVMQIFYDEHIRDLGKLVETGDRYALRIAFKATQLMDGLYAEHLDALIGFSVKVAPAIFLEEAVPFVRSQSKWFASLGAPSEIDWYLGGILVGNIDFDQNRPDVIKKEILLRIAALETVKQKDLLELRDSCLRILRERITLETPLAIARQAMGKIGEYRSPQPSLLVRLAGNREFSDLR